MLFGGGNTGVYGANALPAEMSWNPARFMAENGTAADAAAASPMGRISGVAPLLAAAGVLWLLAERHARIRGKVSGGVD